MMIIDDEYSINPPRDHYIIPDDCVLLTAVSDNMFHDFMFWYHSIRKLYKSISIVVIDLGLSASASTFCDRLYNLKIIKIDQKQIDFFQSFNNICWRQWFKPYFMSLINARVVMWIDCDAVILDDISSIIHKVIDDFVVIRDYFDPINCINDKELYLALNIVPQSPYEDVVLNSGVIAWMPSRDKYIIDAWYEAVCYILSTPHLSKLVKLYDQGVLLCIMHKLRIMTKILPYKAWNCKPSRRDVYDCDVRHLSTNYELWYRNFLRLYHQLKSEHTATILHFAGLPKISQLCEINNPITVHLMMRKKLERSSHVVVGPNWRQLQQVISFMSQSVRADSPCIWKKSYPRGHIRHKVSLQLSLRDGDITSHICHMNRKDVSLMLESSPDYGYFIDDILQQVENSKVIIILHDPFSLVRMSLSQFDISSQILMASPAFYHKDYYEYCLKHRDLPIVIEDYTHYESAVDSLIAYYDQYYDVVLSAMIKHPDRIAVLWYEILHAYDKFYRKTYVTGDIIHLQDRKIDNLAMKLSTKVKKEPSADLCCESDLWIDKLIIDNKAKIFTWFLTKMRNYNINIPRTMAKTI